MATFAAADEGDFEEDTEPENLWVACTNGDIGRLQTLLSEGSTVNQQDENGFSPMHAAASYNQVELLSVLISLGGDVHLRDAEGDTPLLVCETPEVFDLLVAAGADPAAVNAEGEGILQKAVEDELEPLLRHLCDKGLAPEGFTFTARDPDEGEEVDYEQWDQGEGDEEGEGEAGEAAAAGPGNDDDAMQG